MSADNYEEQDSKRAERAAQIEREQVEQVFGLTGGELNDTPWEPFAPHNDSPAEYAWMRALPWDQTSDRVTFHYNYDGVPEWCASDFGCKRHYTPDGEDYVTVVRDCAFSLPTETVIDKGRVWKRIAVLGPSSGECACPWGEHGADVKPGDDDWERSFNGEDGRCPLCERTREEGHGFIYIGDGWCEVVYRCIDPKCEQCDEYIHCGKTEERFCSSECAEEFAHEASYKEQD